MPAEDPRPQPEDLPQPSGRLAEDLAAAFAARVDVPSDVDDAVMAAASRHLAAMRRRRWMVRRVLPARSYNRVPIKLILREPATVGPGDVSLPRWPGAKRIAVAWIYDAPTQPDTSLWLAKALARHGWKGAWLLRGGYPEAIKMIGELQKLGMEIGALPRSAYNPNGLSYAQCLDETMTARF